MRKIVFRIIIRDLRANLNSQRRGIELGDAAHRRPPLHKVIEEGLNIFAGCSKDTHAGNDNSSHACSYNCCRSPRLKPLLKPLRMSDGAEAGRDQPFAGDGSPFAIATRSEISLPSSTRVRLSTAWRTLFMFCATASGISILNSA